MRVLHLGHNKVGDATAKTIADSLRGNSTVLRVLYISTNNIGPEGGVAIGEMLRVNVEMQDLNIASNQIGDAGAVAIAGALKVNPSMYKLSLRLNEIRDAGAIAIAEALAVNKVLVEFYCGGNRYSQPLAPLLARDPSRQPRRAHLARVRARARARAAALAPAPAARVVRLQCEGCSVPMQVRGSGGAPALHTGGQKARARARVFALRPFDLSAPSALAARRRPAGSTAAQRRRSTRAPGGRFTRPVRGGRGPRARHSA